jgi:hypothetical protein
MAGIFHDFFCAMGAVKPDGIAAPEDPAAIAAPEEEEEETACTAGFGPES